MKTLKDVKTRKRWFLISIGLLLLFAVAGQMGIDTICLASELGRSYGYERSLPQMGITVAVTCAAVGLIFLAVRFFPEKKPVLKVLAWVLGIALAGWMLFCTGVSIYKTADYEDVYGAGGLWLAPVDKLEEERVVWSKSHWFGHGDDIYKYSYDEFVDAHSHLSLRHEEEEPYNSILEERDKQMYVFQYLHSETMLNVLSYVYGKWVWLVYLLLALGSVALAISLLPLAGGVPGKLLYCAAWVFFAELTLLPALSGCALVYNGAVGPLFTGDELFYWECGAFFAGPALGVMLGLMFKRRKMPVPANEERQSCLNVLT